MQERIDLFLLLLFFIAALDDRYLWPPSLFLKGGNLSVLGSKRTSDILHFTAALNYIGTSAAGCDLRAYARARRAYIFEFNHERVIRRASGGETNARGGRLTRQKVQARACLQEITGFRRALFCCHSRKRVASFPGNTLRCNLTPINASIAPPKLCVAKRLIQPTQIRAWLNSAPTPRLESESR